jgi:D-sedoheptulose 7-phosphate isomerase
MQVFSPENIVAEHIKQSQNSIQQSLACLSELERAIHLIISQVNQDGKVLLCGNGGSASDAQHFAAELVGRFELEKIAIPAIALNTDGALMTALSNDYSYEHVFAKQVDALGSSKDILIAISTSGNSANVIQAILTAQKRQMHVIAMTGRGGGKIKDILMDQDVHLCAPSDKTSHTQEIHGVWIHAICACIDQVYQRMAADC